MRWPLAVVALLITGLLPEGVQGANLSQDLQAIIDSAPPGQTLIIGGGYYTGPIVIYKPLALVGRGWPIIDGQGRGSVVTITADGASISGFVLKGSSFSPSLEPAAVKVEGAKGVSIVENRIVNSFVGVYLIDADYAEVRANQLDLAPHLPVLRRGHGVYAWETSGATLVENDIRHTADGFYLDHSPDNVIARNSVRSGRYGVHLMYSGDVELIENQLAQDMAGVVAMFSHRLLMVGNRITNNRGATGVGILLKDVDYMYAEANYIEENVFGFVGENSPQSAGASVLLRRNLFAGNDVGMALMPNAPVTLTENTFWDNGQHLQGIGPSIMMRLLGGHGGGADVGQGGGGGGHLPKGMQLSAMGRGNYWDDYRGYDLDGDGVGDIPYQVVNLMGTLVRERPLASAFIYTLAHDVLRMADRLFPAAQSRESLEDPAPLIRPVLSRSAGGQGRVSVSLLLVSLLMVGLPLLLAGHYSFRLLREGHVVGREGH